MLHARGAHRIDRAHLQGVTGMRKRSAPGQRALSSLLPRRAVILRAVGQMLAAWHAVILFVEVRYAAVKGLR